MNIKFIAAGVALILLSADAVLGQGVQFNFYVNTPGSTQVPPPNQGVGGGFQTPKYDKCILQEHHPEQYTCCKLYTYNGQLQYEEQRYLQDGVTMRVYAPNPPTTNTDCRYYPY
jgi:hypothetical protein